MKSIYTLLATIAIAGGSVIPISSHAQELGAFADVGYVTTDEEGAADHFAIGGMDLYANKRIGDNTTAFFEVVFENNGEEFVLDVERYWISREFSRSFKLGVGRFHAPLGHWNRHYHHGVLIQGTVSRPAFLDFEDAEAAILPMHVVGFVASGKVGTGLSYDMSVANGTSYDTSGGSGTGEILIGNVDDGSDEKSLFGNLSYAFESTPLAIGVSAMSNKLLENSTDGTAGVGMGSALAVTTVFGANLTYEDEAVDLLAEYYHVDTEDRTGGVAGNDGNATAFYVQLGYRLSDSWRIAYRYEDLSLDSDTGYFNVLGTGGYTAHLGAIRYELDVTNAVMLEFKRRDGGNSDIFNEITLNWSFLVF